MKRMMIYSNLFHSCCYNDAECSCNLMMLHWFMILKLTCVNTVRSDHLSGKPGNVRDFESCQGNVRDFTKCQGIILSGKSDLKQFIVSCIFASFLDYAEFLHFILVLDHALLYSYPHPLTITLVQARYECRVLTLSDCNYSLYPLSQTRIN